MISIGSDCRKNVRTFSQLYQKSKKNKGIPTDILDELHQTRFKKSIYKTKYSINVLRYTLLLRYRSAQVYKFYYINSPYPTLVF